MKNCHLDLASLIPRLQAGRSLGISLLMHKVGYKKKLYKNGQPSDLAPNGTLGHGTTTALKHEANGQCRSS